jgi:hypothetical protein
MVSIVPADNKQRIFFAFMAFSFYGCRIAKNARAAGGADREVQQSVRDVTALLHLALQPPWGAQCFTAKDAEGAKEEKSFTAKDTKDAEEKNSLTAEDAKAAKRSIIKTKPKGAKELRQSRHWNR